jgi:hypothetical protein
MASRRLAGDTATMPASIRPPLLSLAVVAALLQQLGACPCGCLEHNGWSQSFAWAVGGDLGEDRPGTGISPGHHDCDGAPAELAVLGRPETERPGGDRFGTEPITTEEPIGWIAVPVRVPLEIVALACPPPLALPLRAELQVYRL